MSDPNHQCYWIFTFGSNQPNAGHYVKFFGTFQEAREQMLAKYGQTYIHHECANTIALRDYKQPQAVVVRKERDDEDKEGSE